MVDAKRNNIYNDDDMVYTSMATDNTNNNITDATNGGGGAGGGGDIQIISSLHMDYIHQVVLDVYGRKMATCSGDRFIRVWELNENGQWVLGSQWQAHRGSIACLGWAHPEFGTILATGGSSDHDVKIWEEMTPTVVVGSIPSSSTTTPSGGATNTGSTYVQQQQQAPYHHHHQLGTMTTRNNSNTGLNTSNAAMLSSSSTSWINKASLTEARKAVTCCEFAPKHWGLKIAVGSADGCIRIYEAVDIMDLTQWPLSTTIECFTNNTNDNSSKSGSADNTGMLMNRPNNTNNTTVQTNTGGGTIGGGLNQYNKDVGCTSLSWCTGRFEPPTMVVAGPYLLVYRYIESTRAWQSILKLPSVDNTDALSSVPRIVLDVSWAPNVGRRFHYIAAAEEDTLRIYKLNRQPTSSQQQQQQQQSVPQMTLSLDSTQILSTNAWRCQWNVTGTVLASSGDGGIVQLWKADYNGHFGRVGKVQGDLSSSSTNNNGNGDIIMTTTGQ